MMHPRLLLASLICVVAISACGGSNQKMTISSSPLLALSQCMRAHGVPNFPDPTKGPGGEGYSIDATPGSSTVSIDGITFSGPAFQAAAKLCKFGGSEPPPPISASQKQAMIATTRCIRKHGVPNFPDPVFAPDGQGISIDLPPGLSKQSPAFKNAAKACAHAGAPIPHVPVG